MISFLKRYRQLIIKSIAVIVLTVGLSFSLSLPAWAGVDDFHFKSLDVEYRLSTDEEKRSVLEVKETFVAVFPDFDQNRGMVRAIPLSYQGHSLSLQLGEVYRNGQPAPIAKDSVEDGFRRLEIRDDNYIHGENTFEINYTMRDVTLSPDDDSSIQEFYWDVNGTGWGQTFESVRAVVFLEEGLVDKLTGRAACYTGYEGSNAGACSVEHTPEGGFVIEANKPLLARQNLTLAIGFDAETFAPYQLTSWQKTLVLLAKVATVVLAVIVVGLMIKRVRLGGGVKNKSAIVTQYLPPKELDVLQSAVLLNAPTKAATATLIDLAVRHKINIKEIKGSGIFRHQKDYKIEVIDDTDLTANEKAILRSYLQKDVALGSSMVIKRNDDNSKIATDVYSARDKAFKHLKELGYYQDPPEKSKLFNFALLAMVLSIANAALSIWLNSQFLLDDSAWLMAAAPIVAVATVGIAVSLASMRLKTKTGADVVHYLKGLEQYIKLAESERLAFAQAADTAQTVPGETEAERRVVLYERILPYAMLFNLEKTWSKVLEAVYEETGTVPAWYIGTGAFSASDFSHSLSSFSSSASSSSSSGSGGGGSSGGGGGGGGGGGC